MNPQRAAPLLVIGHFPPPVNGQSVMTQIVAEHLAARVPVTRVPIGKGSAVSKIVGHLRAARHLLGGRGGGAAYSTPPGNRSLWLFLLIVAAARMRGVKLFVHHHSFRPIAAGPLAAMRLLTYIGGDRIHHIFLSDAMRARFFATYVRADPASCSVVPNAFAYPPIASFAREAPAATQVLGHISVLTREKGLLRVLDVFDRLRAQGRPVRLVIAGPVADKTLTAPIAEAARRHGAAFEYRGATFGEQKARFFLDVDLLLLPSTLIDEADPIVILEAYASGAAVMASDRGCIPERLVSPEAILTLDPTADTARVGDTLDAIACRGPEIRALHRAHALKMHVEAQALAEALWHRIEAAQRGS